MPTAPGTDQSRLRTITVLAPVPEPALDELTERLREVHRRPSPFSALAGTHFARLAVIPRTAVHRQRRPAGMRLPARLLDLIMHGGRAQLPDPPSRSYLLFSASYDAIPGTGDDLHYLEGLRVGLKGSADEIWGLCSDYPGWSDQAGFLTFFVQRTLPQPGYVFSASDDEPPVARVRQALRLRQRVIDFAVETDGLADDQLVKQLRQVFLDSPATDSAGGSQPVLTGTVSEHLPVASDPESALFEEAPGIRRLGLDGRAPRTMPNLSDVQNLVTSGYPRHLVSRHLLLRITDPPAARRWLGLIAGAIPTAAWAERYVDRFDGAGVLPDDPGTGRASSPDFAVHLALSYAGLVRLGLPGAELAGFGAEFQAGMASREAGLTPGRGVSTWQPPFLPGERGGVHLLVLLSAADQDVLAQRLADRPELAPGPDHGVHLLAAFDGNRLPQDVGRPEAASRGCAGRPGFVEHFGFADGLSQPRIHGVTASGRAAELPAGEVLLGYQDVDGDTAGAGLPAELARNGSYLVYRRLEQDVPAFRDLTRRLAERMRGTPELAGAKLIGRWPDGTPLAASGDRADPALAQQPFGYQEQDAEGRRCPVGAHIRRANPRDSRPVDPDTGPPVGGRPGLEQELSLRHRMLRRGIPYGAMLPDLSDGPVGDGTAGDGSAGDGTAADGGERGMLFLALVGDLRRQFEFIQAHWLADGNAFRLGSDRDVLSGAAQEDTKIVVQGDPPTFLQPPTPLVTCRGGEYFFLPGIAALRRIAAGGADHD